LSIIYKFDDLLSYYVVIIEDLSQSELRAEREALDLARRLCANKNAAQG